MSPEDLLQEARMVLEGKGLAGMEKEFRQGSRRPEFLKSYMAMLGRADRYREAGEIAAVYFSALPSDCLREAEYWDIFDRYYMLADTDLFQYVLTHRKELYDLYGEDKVRKKIAAVWIAGAENFVQDGVFDEAGFKAYTKRLKKKKSKSGGKLSGMPGCMLPNAPGTGVHSSIWQRKNGTKKKFPMPNCTAGE